MMKNKKLAALLGLLLAGSMTVSMAACGSTNSASDTKADSSSQSSDSSSSDSSSDSGAGFEEVPVGPSGTAEEQDQDAGPLTVGAVYFQPFVKTHFGSDGSLPAMVTGKRFYQFIMESGDSVTVYIKTD